MTTTFSLSLGGDPVIVSAKNKDSSYILWQRETASDAVYFEYDDQKNGGYHIVEECTIDQDGCHVMLNSGELIHFYWNPQRHPQLPEFVSAMRALYSERPGVLEIHDYQGFA